MEIPKILLSKAEEIEAILEEFGDKNIDREKIFRKGIGLDE